MHPKAAYLALHGFVPARFWPREHKPLHAPTVNEWRIKRQLKDMEQQLLEGLVGDRRDWVMSNAAELHQYRELPWSSVPDEVLDSIPQGLIEKFVSTC